MPAWPRQREAIRKIRQVLRRAYGADDSWVVQSGGECRIEVLVGGHRAVLHADEEARVWSEFYRKVMRIYTRGGEFRRVEVLRPRRIREITEILRPYWERLPQRSEVE